MDSNERQPELDPTPSLDLMDKVPEQTTVAGQVTSESVSRNRTQRDTPLTQDEKRRVEKAKKIMFDMAKTVRSFNIYNKNNEAIQKFFNDLYDRICEFLDHEERVLSFRIRPESIHYIDEMVYENSNRDESIAVKLYKDGLKEIVFEQGLEKDEVIDFIRLLNLNLDQPEYHDDDIVSLMWERDFNHISYFVIEGFSENLDQQKKQEIQDDIDLILSLVYSDKPPEHSLKGARLSKEDIYQYFQQDSIEEGIDVKDVDDFQNHFVVTREEVNNLKREIESLSDTDMIFQMVDIIINLLSRESDHDNFLKIGEVLIQIIDMLLIRADFTNTTRIIKRLREIAIAGSHQSDEDPEEMQIQGSLVESEFHQNVRLGTWILEIIENLGHEQRIEQIVNALNQGFRGKPSEIFDFIVSLNSSAVPSLLNGLGDINKISHRRLICDAILIIQDGDISHFARKLYDERWFVVSDMLYILGKIGHADALTYMKKAYEHENPKVRCEAIAAMRRFPIAKVRDLYLHALEDENMQVQLQALRVIAQHKDHGAVEPILALVESKDFMDFPLSIKKRYFMTLALLEKQDLAPYFIKSLKRNRFWLGNINTDIRVCSAFALGIVGSGEAVKVLKRCSRTWSRRLREACRDALIRADSGPISDGLILEPLQQTAQGELSNDLILEPLSK